MSLEKQLAAALMRVTPGGYSTRREPCASEPTALATMALTTAREYVAAARGCLWLTNVQADNGAVGVTSAEATPAWPTALALLAWHRWQSATGETIFNSNIERAMTWVLAAKGETSPRAPEVGHDSTLLGWSWVENTHCWLEPSAFFVRAGIELGLADHPRFRTGVRLLLDRQLPAGGCNYGNTIVLGQALLPHVQPTGITMWALGIAGVGKGAVAKTLDYLAGSINERSTPASLSWAVLGLAAHNRLEARHRPLLTNLATRTLALNKPTAAYPLSLLLLALTSAAESSDSVLATHPTSAS